ncbi:MAG TPA: MBL fold metallo-hydrolase [Pyrinomonadaceae bacterium]|jgi:glyoxylase-like metal-dependent hydrolase (beta-lactamase superfamily II)/ferredoxin
MANPAKRLVENVPGDFFVDSTCIDCDACRQIAPKIFRDHGDQSSVYRQPETEDELRLALMALVACPTGSIGSTEKHDARIGIDAFPSLIAENVYFCGFCAESSFGAWSYLVVRPESEGGNVLVDSPRFTGPLVKKIAAMGGARQMFLTHKDDVADHARFAEKFGTVRIMHERDGAARHGVEQVIEGDAEVRLDQDFRVIPVPGHTRGHMVLLYKNRFLFTGDHLAWSPARSTLTAFRSACWYSWTEQTRSMTKLLDYDFEWVLPGHGRIHHDNAAAMRSHLSRCIEWMKATQ